MPLLMTLVLSAWWARANDVSPGLSVGEDGTLRLAGKPFRGIGVNYYDAFVRTLAEPARTNYDAGFRVLAGQGIPFVRFSAGGYWPAEWVLYRTNRAEYFARFDALVKSAEQHQVGLIPSLFWLLSTVPDLVGESCNQWGNPASRTQAFMREYAREVVTRYRASPAIWAWEFGNEYNLVADLPNAAEHRPAVVPSLGTPAARSARDELTHDQIHAAFTAFAAEVRRHDPHRLIITGNAFPRVSAWHQRAEKSWAKDTPEQFAQMLAGDNPGPVNSLSVRAYDASDTDRLRSAMRVTAQVRKPLFVGEFGVPGKPTPESQRRFAEILAELAREQVPLAALWVFDFDGQADDWSVTATNARAYQLDAVGAVNRRLRDAAPSRAAP
jgi:hypothetical protein